MRRRQVANLAPYRAYLFSISTIQTEILIENKVTDSFFLCFGEVFANQFIVLFQFFFCEKGFTSFFYCIELIATLMFGSIFLSYSIAFVIAEVIYLLSYLLVFLRYFIGTYGFTYLFAKAFLGFYLYFDRFMSKVNSISHILFRYLIHFPFYHGNKLLRGSDHDIHIRFCQLLCTWVDDELPIDTSYAYLGDRSIERDIRYRQASRGSESRQGIRHHVLIMRHELNHHLHFAVVFLRK